MRIKKREEIIIIHNNIARRKGLPGLPLGVRLSIDELADRLQAVSAYRHPEPRAWVKKLIKFLRGK